LVVDDHPIMRKGIKDLLVGEGLCESVEEAASAEAAMTAVRREPWDLLVLDVALPDKHGIEVLKEVKLLRPTLPVLMVSLYPEREFALRAIKAGASGYLTKDQPPSELVRAVKEVLAGRRYITPSLANQMADLLDHRQPETLHERLSDREMEVLRLLGQGKTVSAIADEMALSVKTISTYRGRLLEKLKLATTADLVRYAIEHHLTT
jgi:two-component system, NarL family, invasion response regulator UvrY